MAVDKELLMEAIEQAMASTALEPEISFSKENDNIKKKVLSLGGNINGGMERLHDGRNGSFKK